MDRVYLSSPNAIAILDHGRKRTYVIRKDGLPDVGKLCSVKLCMHNFVNEQKVKRCSTFWVVNLIIYLPFFMPTNSGVESMGEEIKSNGGFWR